MGCSKDKPDPVTQSNSPSSYAQGCPPPLKKHRSCPPSFLPRTTPSTSISAPIAPPGMPAGPCPQLSPSVPNKIRALGHPHPRRGRSVGRDRPAPQVCWGENAGTAWENHSREPKPWHQPRSLAPARQTHQLEDVLVLGHDGELQHIVTAGRGDGGVRPAAVGPSRVPFTSPPQLCLSLRSSQPREGTHLFWISAMTCE